MKVVLINTSDLQGGAAIACHRLGVALSARPDVDVSILVKEQSGKAQFVVNANPGWIGEKVGTMRFAFEKLHFLMHEANADIRFQFSNPIFGQDISTHPLVAGADVIHLHWINKGYLSFDSLQKLFNLGKPIVWTLHDMWAFTGGCHYARECTHYLEQCGNCYYLKQPSSQDISRTVWNKKRNLYQGKPIHVVACSKWLANKASASSLFANVPVTDIPNTVDTNIFKPGPKVDKDSYTILFQSMNIYDERKGLKYFIEALAVLKKEHSALAKKIKLLIFGKGDGSLFEHLDYEVSYLGMLSGQEQIANAYRQSDIFVIPSLADNLPNTVMESLASGVPVVGFETGGIPEMVDHQVNGYIAKQKDANDLAAGIAWTLAEGERYTSLSRNAVEKVRTNYAHKIVGGRYAALYESVLS